MVSVLRLASPSEGFVGTGASRLQYSRRATNSGTTAVAVPSQHHGRPTLRMGAAGKKRKKVCVYRSIACSTLLLRVIYILGLADD